MTVDSSTSADSTTRDTGLGNPVPQTADPIDRVVSLAPRWTVFVLIACGFLVAGLIAWGFGGTVTSSITTEGLYNENGDASVETPKEATVAQVLVSLDQEVTEGQELVALTDGSVLTSPQDGTVTAILVSNGSLMYPGKTAVRVTDLSVPDNVVVMVPASMTGWIVPGLPVRIEVSSAPSSQYGYLIGEVDEISAGPYTVDQVADILNLEPAVVINQFGPEPALLAIVDLQYDPDTPSNYAWTIGDGPPWLITQGVPVVAQIITSEQKPISIVFPGLG